MRKQPAIFRPSHNHGYTFVELMVCLSIFSMISLAATSLMFASYNTNRHIRTEDESIQQMETALRRMIDNVRSASTLGPYFSSSPVCLDLLTQADPDNSQLKYEIKYTLNAQGQLIETHDLYGSNVLANGITNFTLTVVQDTKPTMLQITLTMQQPQASVITRTCFVTSRNF